MKHVGGDMGNWYLLGHINMPKKMEDKSESWDNTKGWQSYDYA